MKLSDYIYHQELAGVIYCGDCLEILPLLADGDVEIVVTDPPYNISKFNSKSGDFNRNWRPSGIKLCFGDWDVDYKPELFLRAVLPKNPIGVVVFSSSETFGDYIKWLSEAEYRYCKYIVWEKTNPSPSIRKTTWRQSTELIIHAHSEDGFHLTDQNDMRNVIKENTCAAESVDHGNQKPLRLMKKLIKASSLESQSIIDPFLGSGTTAVAAKQLGRKFIGIEISEKYCEIAKQRLAQEELF